MKIYTPLNREDLHIRKKDYVLEVGSGHNPTFRANVIVEKYIESNYHRADNIKIYPHQTFVNADGSNMPFKDKEFDYVICNQVLEHTEDPVQFVKELQRVASKGYIELPSLIGESLFPKESHKWVALEINNKLILYRKSKIPRFYPDYGKTFLNFLPYQSIALRVFYLSYHQINTIRYEWKDTIDIVINPENEFYKSFFFKTWDKEMISNIFPSRSFQKDLLISFKALLYLIKCMVKRRVFPHNPISLEEYTQMNNAHLEIIP